MNYRDKATKRSKNHTIVKQAKPADTHNFDTARNLLIFI